MNREQAKEILSLHRVDAATAGNDELAAARRLLVDDAELAAWWEAHRAFDAGVRGALEGIPVPAGLADCILQELPQAKRIVWWRQPVVWAAAASVVLWLGFWLHHQALNREFAAFNIRLARAALRDYRMELRTNSLPAIRDYLAHRGCPADYELHAGLERLPGLGCGSLRWRNQPVSMICFERNPDQLVWLFVTDAASVAGAPRSARPVIRTVGELSLAAWSEGRRLYVVAAVGPPEILHDYL